MTEQEMLKKLRQELAKLGNNVSALSRKISISPSYLLDVLAGKKPISDRLARSLGYKKQVVYDKL